MCFGLMAAAAVHAANSAGGTTAGLQSLEETGSEPLIERVNKAQEREYGAVIAEIDAYVAAHPNDVVAAVERCRFIEHFADAEDVVIESASEEFDGCADDLGKGAFAEAAAVKLYQLERQWGEGARKQAEILLPQAAKWTPRQQAELEEHLANLYARQDLIKAGAHAARAIRLKPDSSVRLIAAEYFIRIGAKAAAVRTIEAMPQDQWNAWNLARAVDLLLGVEAATAAQRLLDREASITIDTNTRLRLARALFTAGANEAAHRLMKAASSLNGATPQQRAAVPALRELFELERDHGSMQSASAAYRRLRNEGYRADPFARHRVSLTLRYPFAPWHAEDLLGIGAFLLAMCVFALLPLIVVAPLHYRSLAKQLRGITPQPAGPTTPWSFGHAWYALAVLMVAGTGALYFSDYPAFHAVVAAPFASLATSYPAIASDRQLGTAMLVSLVVSVIALLPLVRRLDVRSFLVGEWSIRRSVFTGIGVAFVLLLVTAIVRLTARKLFPTMALGTDTSRSLQGIRSAYGVPALFLFTAGAVPMLEEFVFRGVLLRTFSRYFALWFAVLVQAGVFMTWHEDRSTYPFIFVFALVAAWLARRSGGLLAPIAFHATNNAFAALSLLVMSQALELIK